MNPRTWGLLAAVVLPICGTAAELSDLPEVLATVGGRPLRRDELAGQLAPQLARLNAEGAGSGEVRRSVRQIVDDEICRRLLDVELRKNALVPSREIAVRYLKGVLEELAPVAAMKLEHELRPRLDEPDFQLKAAVHFYLEKRFPPKALTVSSTEIERYYHLNRMRYRLPEHWEAGVIRIDRSRKDAVELAATARARLLQGGAFEAIAREFDPEGGGDKLSADELSSLFAGELAKMSPGDVSNVMSTPDAFFILLLRRKDPGGAIPIEEAEPYIRLELSAAKDSLALRKVLIRDFAEANVVYDPFLKP